MLLDPRNNQQGNTFYRNTFTGLVPGQSYTASVWLASAYHLMPPQVSVELPGTTAAPVTPSLPPVTNNAAPDLPWVQASLTFTATATTQVLRIVETRNASGSGNDLAIDNLSITHVCTGQDAPTATATVVGQAEQGQTLSGSDTYADAQSDAQDITPAGTQYSWVRSNNPGLTDPSQGTQVQGGATLGQPQSYTLQAGDVGQYLSYCVTPAAQTGQSPGATVCSTAIGPVTRSTTVTPTVAPVPGLGQGSLAVLGLLAAALGVRHRRKPTR